MKPAGKSLHLALLSYRGNMFCGGQGVYLVNLARALVERGHRVKVMAGPPYPDPVDGAENIRVPNHNFINKQAGELPRGAPLSVFGPINFFEYGLARAGVNPEMLAFSMRVFKLIRDVHAADPLDAVHDNQGLGYGLLLVRALGIPALSTIHHPLQVDRGEDIMQTAGLVAKARRALYYPIVMQRLVAGRLDGLITVSEFSRELVARTYGLDRDRIAVAENGVGPDWFGDGGGVRRERGRLLFVGSTEDRKKGVIYLLEALAELPASFHLVIVDGRRYPGRVYAEDAVRRLGLSDRVEFLDRISVEELKREYGRAEMMVMPSLFEGFGLPALEAMAAGTPLICSRAGALPEVAGPDCAELIEPRSAEAIREAALRLSGDGERLARMSALGRERAEKLFTWDGCAAKVLDQYLLAIERRGRARGAAA